MIDELKNTSLGGIPKEWNLYRLGKILSSYKLGGNYKNAEDADGLPLIKMGNIDRGQIKLNKVEFVPNELYYDENDILNEGDLLFNTRNTLELVGKVAIWRNELPKALYNSNLLRLSFNKDKVKSNYFMNYVFNSKYGIKQLRAYATGTTSVAAIYTKDLLKFKVILPPLPEQLKIADILSTVDAKINIISEQITETQELKKGLMQRLLTKGIGHTEFKNSPLGNIPKSWEVVKIQDLLDEKKIISHLDGNHGGLYPKAEEFINEGVPYISANCFLDNRVDFSKCKHLSMERSLRFKKGVAKNGDVLFAHNATVGPVAFLETDLDFVILSTTATYFRLDNKNIDAKYWLYFLSSPIFKNQYEKVMGQSTRNQVPITMQRSFLSVLPTFEEQKEISEVLNTVDQKLEILSEKKVTYQDLKQGLMQQLLTGKVRVKV